MGPNLCLLEDLIHGEVELFIEERRAWWSQWFSNIDPWRPVDVDMERLRWIKAVGILYHAWGFKLFNLIIDAFRSFIRCDDQTISRVKIEEARFLVKTSIKSSINEACVIVVDGESFRCFLNEYSNSIFLNSSVNLDNDEEGSEYSSSPTESNSKGEECDSAEESIVPNVPLTSVQLQMLTSEEMPGSKGAADVPQAVYGKEL